MIDYKCVSELLVQYFFNSQDAQCLLCDNCMKNINIKYSGIQGCDGNCRWDRKYTKEDLLEIFIEECKPNNISEIL